MRSVSTSRQAARAVRHVAIAGALAALAGCAAPDLDPAPDLKDAAGLVAARSAWTPTWNTPWADDTTSWDGAAPLTVAQAVTVALQNNRGLRTDLEAIAGAKADLAQSGLLPNPVLSLEYGRNHIGEVTAIGLVQELTELWLRPAHRDAAAMALRVQVQTASDHALRLVADVRIAHAKVVFGQRGTALTMAHLDQIQRALDVAQGRVDAGEGTQLDVNRLREEQLSTQADLQTQKLDLSKTKRDLLALLGRAAAGADWLAAEDPREQDVPGSAALTETDAVARACALRLDVQAALSLVEQRRHDLRAASLGRIPETSLGLTHDKDEESLKTRSAELDVEVPVFDTKEAGVARAESDLRAAEAASDQVMQIAISDTRSAFLELQTNVRLVAFFREQVLALAQQNVDAAQRSYDAGEIDLTDVLDTQREQSESQSKLNDLQLNAATSLAELEYVVGGKL